MDLVELRIKQDVSKRHPWELARKELVKDLIEHALAGRTLEARPIQVLDIGSGDSFVVANLAEDLPEYQFYGYDIYHTAEDLQVLDQLYGKIPNLLLSPSLDEIGKQTDKISLVLLLDVIEHIESEITFLKELRAHPLIGPDTIFVITIPAYQGLFTAHDEYLKHFRRYTRGMLIDRVGQAGYTVVESLYFFTSLLLPRTIQKIRQEITGKKADFVGLAGWRQGEAVTSMVKNILYTDYRISKSLGKLGLRLPGLSLYGIIKPKA